MRSAISFCLSAYHLEPGHNVHIDEDVEFVEFTPADQTPGVNTLELSSEAGGVGARS